MWPLTSPHHTHPKTALIPGPEMQSASTLDRVFLSAPPGWGAVNTTTTEKENHSFPPHFSYQGTTSSHRPSSGQTAIKTPVFWWRGGHAPTADLYTWFLSVHLLQPPIDTPAQEASALWTYHHLCLEMCHIWQKRIQLRYLWSPPLMNELPPKRLQMCRRGV